MVTTPLQDFSNFPRIAIIGFGQEGQSTYAFLRQNGVDAGRITLYDDRSIDAPYETETRVCLGRKNLPIVLSENDLAFRTPSFSADIFANYYSRARITSQILWFLEHRPATTRVIGVTATKGKSTTVTLMARAAEAAGVPTLLAGNIGKPILTAFDTTNPPELVILELSSYMLEDCPNPNLDVAVWNNLFPDHLNHHGSFDAYRQAKTNILRGAKHVVLGAELLQNGIVGYDGKTLSSYEGPIGTPQTVDIVGKEGFYAMTSTAYLHGDTPLNVWPADSRLLGEHNHRNILSAIAALRAVGVDSDTTAMKHTLKTFGGLPHRLEIVGTFGDITYVDDAISTTPESTIAAVRSFAVGSIGCIFLGGEDRGYAFEELVNVLKNEVHVPYAFCFPQSGLRIMPLLATAGIHAEYGDTMEAAIAFAKKNTPKNTLCLLSCASPSYSLWKNFEVKGDEFAHLAQASE